jgi:hypothetical protein
VSLSRKHLDVLLFGSLLLLGAYVVRGWLHESDDSSAHGSTPGVEKPAPKPPPPLALAPVPAPALDRDAVPVLDRVDPAKDKIAGEWTLKEGRLISPAVKWARFQLPCIPPEEYDFNGVITRADKDDALILGLVYQGRQCQVVLDGNGGRASWMEVKGGGHGVTPFGVTFFDGNVFAKGRPARLQVSVRKSRLTVTVDSFRIIDYIGSRDPLFIAEHWEAPDTRTLYLGAWETIFAVDHLSITPVQGSVAFTR